MKHIFVAVFALFFCLFLVQASRALHYAERTSGKILLQVEENGEAWYVYPPNGKRYFLGRPHDAFEIMKKLGLGARHDYIADTEIFPNRLAGMILLDVEKSGEAYYIYPDDMKKYYLARPADAFRIMRKLGLGISNGDLIKIPPGDINETALEFPGQDTIIHDVPFTAQAPFGNWSDQRQQDGCEEAAAIMALKWARGENLSQQEALDLITDISDYELEKYGEYRDISSADTISWIFNDYFGYYNVELKKDISIENIINEINRGNIAITPHNGQLLNNPNFTPPGPVRHMLVIRGYDAQKQEFITNDPGTRNGEAYRYSSEVLFRAIRDYPTGYHEDIGRIEKNMIVVSK